MNAEAAIVKMAEACSREEQRRARDVANAIADFEAAEGDEAKAFEGMSLVAASRHADQRFEAAMARVTQGLLEEATGKSLEQVLEDVRSRGGDGFGLALNKESGLIEVIDSEGEAIELESGESDPDTTPVGDADIPGIDLSLEVEEEAKDG